MKRANNKRIYICPQQQASGGYLILLFIFIVVASPFFLSSSPTSHSKGTCWHGVDSTICLLDKAKGLG